jgi:ABC-type sugar transport system substrate-binding protein
MIILCSLLGCGCSKKEQEVLVVLSSQDELAYEELRLAASQWAEEKNISLHTVAPKTPMVYEQQTVLENSIREKKWDFIVLEPLGNTELYPVLDYAKEQGSIIISMQGASALDADYTIQPYDYEKLGISIMDVFAEKMGQSGSYVTVVSAKDSESALQEELACVNQQKNNYQQMLSVSRLQEGNNVQMVYDTMDTLFHTHEMKGAVFFSYIDGLGISQWKQKTGNDLITVGIGYPELLNTDTENGAIDALFYWNRENLLITSLEVGYKAVQGSIEKEPNVIITHVEGYRTLRSLGDGAYYGNDISIIYN